MGKNIKYNNMVGHNICDETITYQNVINNFLPRT